MPVASVWNTRPDGSCLRTPHKPDAHNHQLQ
uniref:Uncharacterized protein n=1 Tax=Arundo donax TaxID=35708 RepID=A0A0A8ZM93_ARUDO